MDGWGDTRACPLCRDLSLHMEQELFISSSKAPRGWVGAPGHREDLRHLQEPDVTPEPERFLLRGKMRRTCLRNGESPR